MYTYVFENKEYEVALNNVKAILFDIVTKEEEKLTALSEKAMNSGDNSLQQSFNELRSEQDDCLKLVLSISNQLAETLKKLDSYSRELRHIEDKNIADIIANMAVSNSNVDINSNSNANLNGDLSYINSFNESNTKNPFVATPSVNTNNYVETSYVHEQPMMTATQNDVVEEVMPYNDSLSNVIEEVVEYIPEKAPSTVGAVEVINEEVMPYDDSLSNVVEEVVEYIPEEVPNEANTEKVPSTNNSEVIEEVMPYDDEISTVTAEGEASVDTVSEDAEAKSNDNAELIPTSDDNSSVKLVIPGATNTASSDNSDSNSNEKVEEETKTAVQLVIPSVSTNNNVNEKVETTSGPLIIPTGDSSDENEKTIDPILEDALKEDNKKDGEVANILIFKKRTNDLAKAILTSGKQNTSLRASLATQEALLKARGFFDNLNESNLETQLVANGLLPGDINSQIEQMMNQANELYTAGKVEEAQAMYDKISELNKQVQNSEVKVA